MNAPDIKRLLQLLAFGLGILLLLGGYAMTNASAARAIPTNDDICAHLNMNPTLDGVTQVGSALLPYAASANDVGVRIAHAVQTMCPQHIPLIKQWALRATAGSPLEG